MSRQTPVVAVALLALGVAPLRAQEKEPARTEPAARAENAEGRAEQEGPRSTRGVATLRVQLVISRYQGEKKTGSLPYTFVVTGGERFRMRMGVDTPVPTSASSSGKPDGEPPASPRSPSSIATSERTSTARREPSRTIGTSWP